MSLFLSIIGNVMSTCHDGLLSYNRVRNLVALIVYATLTPYFSNSERPNPSFTNLPKNNKVSLVAVRKIDLSSEEDI